MALIEAKEDDDDDDANMEDHCRVHPEISGLETKRSHCYAFNVKIVLKDVWHPLVLITLGVICGGSNRTSGTF